MRDLSSPTRATVTVQASWQASDARATVVIDGFAGTQPSSGSFTIPTGPRTFTGHASVACGAGPMATTTVTAAPLPSGSLTGASSITITPVSTGFLRCCDGTLSNSCTSCANKQGCCSHHGGVCGC